MRKKHRQGLSLLEVIIATIVLAVSSIMLVQIIGTADRNAQRAELRVTGQLVCQNRMDELLSGLISLESTDAQPTLYYPDWQCSVDVTDWTTNEFDLGAEGRLVLIEVQAFYQPIDGETNDTPSVDKEFDKPVYTLRRLTRVAAPADAEERDGGTFERLE